MSRNLPEEDALLSQRERIVRLCAWMTNDPDAAEDLAQETLIVAWRRQQDLRDPQRFPQWLSRIAHNVCLKWASKRGKELARSLRLPPVVEASRSDDAPESDLEQQLIDDFDLELELERKELAELLDRALALLPPETRTILIQRYIEESPLSEIAARLGINPNAAAKRLERGKLTFRRVLTTQMSQQIAPYLIQTLRSEWIETPLWCLICGMHHWQGRIEPLSKQLLLTCPGCYIDPNPSDTDVDSILPSMLLNNLKRLAGGRAFWLINSTTQPDIKGYRRAISKELVGIHDYLQPHLATRCIPCCKCGKICLLQRIGPAALFFLCSSCGGWSVIDCGLLLLMVPAAREFYLEHNRIRTLPMRQIEVDGRAALISGFESLKSNNKLEMIIANDTFEVLYVFKDRSEIITK